MYMCAVINVDVGWQTPCVQWQHHLENIISRSMLLRRQCLVVTVHHTADYRAHFTRSRCTLVARWCIQLTEYWTCDFQSRVNHHLGQLSIASPGVAKSSTSLGCRWESHRCRVRLHCVITYGLWFPVMVIWFPRTVISNFFCLHMSCAPIEGSDRGIRLETEASWRLLNARWDH